MIVLLNLLSKYWIEHVSIGLLYDNFIFKIRVFKSRVPEVATVGPCGVWCRGLTPFPCMLVHLKEFEFSSCANMCIHQYLKI